MTPKKQVDPPYRPFKNFTKMLVFKPSEPDYPVLSGYLSRFEVMTFMVKEPTISFMIHMLPGQFFIQKRHIAEFVFTDDNDIVIRLKSEDSTVIKLAPREGVPA